eukprot:10916-Pelagococcus_subviridis.AAC.1
MADSDDALPGSSTSPLRSFGGASGPTPPTTRTYAGFFAPPSPSPSPSPSLFLFFFGRNRAERSTVGSSNMFRDANPRPVAALISSRFAASRFALSCLSNSASRSTSHMRTFRRSHTLTALGGAPAFAFAFAFAFVRSLESSSDAPAAAAATT